MNEMDVCKNATLRDISNISNEIESKRARLENAEVPPVENNVFRFLTKSLMGRIILGRYVISKHLDYSKLKEILILNEIEKDPINFKIRREQFEQLANEIVEIFPTEDKDFFYVPALNYQQQFIGARGCLYNEYKVIRKYLREGGILKIKEVNDEPATNDSADIIDRQDSQSSLKDLLKMTVNGSATEIIEKWEGSFCERGRLLSPPQNKKKKPVSLEVYFKSFPCLSHPLAIVLLQSDFQNIIEEYLKNEGSDNYSSIFFNHWSNAAERIMKICKASKKPEVKEFFLKNKIQIDEGKSNNILALYLLPLYLGVPKIVKSANSENIVLSRADISKSFILSVEDPSNLVIEQEKHEQWLMKLQSLYYPYVIFCGKLQEIHTSYVVIKGERYSYTDPLKAIEACLQCMVAIRSSPTASENLWFFMQKLVYGNVFSNLVKLPSNVTKFIVDIHKFQSTT